MATNNPNSVRNSQLFGVTEFTSISLQSPLNSIAPEVLGKIMDFVVGSPANLCPLRVSKTFPRVVYHLPDTPDVPGRYKFFDANMEPANASAVKDFLAVSIAGSRKVQEAAKKAFYRANVFDFGTNLASMLEYQRALEARQRLELVHELRFDIPFRRMGERELSLAAYVFRGLYYLSYTWSASAPARIRYPAFWRAVRIPSLQDLADRGLPPVTFVPSASGGEFSVEELVALSTYLPPVEFVWRIADQGAVSVEDITMSDVLAAKSIEEFLVDEEEEDDRETVDAELDEQDEYQREQDWPEKEMLAGASALTDADWLPFKHTTSRSGPGRSQ